MVGGSTLFFLSPTFYTRWGGNVMPYSGTDVGFLYDPMICKLITYGDDRDQALERMRKALDQ